MKLCIVRRFSSARFSIRCSFEPQRLQLRLGIRRRRLQNLSLVYIVMHVRPQFAHNAPMPPKQALVGFFLSAAIIDRCPSSCNRPVIDRRLTTAAPVIDVQTGPPVAGRPRRCARNRPVIEPVLDPPWQVPSAPKVGAPRRAALPPRHGGAWRPRAPSPKLHARRHGVPRRRYGVRPAGTLRRRSFVGAAGTGPLAGAPAARQAGRGARPLPGPSAPEVASNVRRGIDMRQQHVDHVQTNCVWLISALKFAEIGDDRSVWLFLVVDHSCIDCLAYRVHVPIRSRLD